MSVTVNMKDLTVELDGKTILDGITTELEGGVINSLIGPNGAGKTTLIHALLGFAPYKGTIHFEGLGRKPRIGYVPQKTNVEPGAPLTVADFLSAGLTRRPVWSGVRKPLQAQIEQTLGDVGIPDRLHRRLDALSGGEFQRVMLAQALMRDPDLLILDEPNTGMDISGHQLFCGLVDRIHRERQTTTLLITHDLGVVADHSKRAIGLNVSVQFQGPVPETLSEENLVRLFGPHSHGWNSTAGSTHRHNGRIA